MSENYNVGSLYNIKLDDLQSDPDQPRKYFDPVAKEDLVNSLKKHGVLEPILFRVDKEGKLIIVVGERRCQAAKEAGLETMPAIFVEGNYDEIALVENILREDLTAMELAESLDRVMKDHGYTQEQLKPIIGKHKSTISEILSLNRLPDDIRDECRSNPSIPRKALIKIAKMKRPEKMLKAYKKYKDSHSKEKVREKRGRKKTWQDKFTSKSDALTTFVEDMDFETLDVPERKELVSYIEKLKKTVDKLIAKINAAPAKKAKPEKTPKPKKEPKEKKIKAPKVSKKSQSKK